MGPFNRSGRHPPSLVAQGHPQVASPAGGSYGLNVPAIGTADSAGSTSRTLAGQRQDSRFRTNIGFASMKELDAYVTLQAQLPDGTTGSWSTSTRSRG